MQICLIHDGAHEGSEDRSFSERGCVAQSTIISNSSFSEKEKTGLTNITSILMDLVTDCHRRLAALR